MATLQDPLTVGSRQLANRLVMAPMVTAMAEDHHATQEHAAWYGSRAQGLGLVVVECAAVAADGLLVPRQLGIWDDAFLPGLSEIARAIHAEGVPAVLQLVHGGARAWTDGSTERRGPSTLRLAAGQAPQALSPEAMACVRAQFVAAAQRALAAGFDGVEVHAAHGYLLSEFLCPAMNDRTDAWGGSLEGRMRFPQSVVAAVRSVVPAERMLLVRMHAQEAFEGGASLEDLQAIAQMFVAAGADLLDLSGIGQARRSEDALGTFLATSSVGPKGWEPGAYAAASQAIRAAVSVPVITVGRMAEEDAATRVLAEGQADLVALARQLLADPEAARHLLAGTPDRILRCEECLACFASIRTGPVRCSLW